MKHDLTTTPYHHSLYQYHQTPTSNADHLPKKPKSNENPPQSNDKALILVTAADGATIEVPKRPRGRPPGSKNKPKPPTFVTQTTDPQAALRPHILEIPAGQDVADSLARFSTRRNLGICVLAGTGAVANVSLRQPSPATATVVFHGRFEVLSMSGTFMPRAMAQGLSGGGLAVSLAGTQGRIVGGLVAGPLVAATPVVVVCAAFDNVTVHRLPGDDEGSGSGSGHEREYDERSAQAHEVEQQQEMCGYSGHYPPDVMWGSSGRGSPPGF